MRTAIKYCTLTQKIKYKNNNNNAIKITHYKKLLQIF